MAKCVQNVHSMEIRRVSNDQARELVNSNTWEYLPKWFWKKNARALAWSGNRGKAFEGIEL